MSTDARLLITGFSSLEEATAAADAARTVLMGPTRLTCLGTHISLDDHATCWELDSYTDVAGLTIVEAASPLRWKPDPLAHSGLRDFLSSLVDQFPSRNYFWAGDETAAQVRYNDAPFAHELGRGAIQSLLNLT